MGANKDTFMSIRIQAEIEDEHWNSLPDEYKDRFNVKRIEVETINGQDAKEVYKKDIVWRELREVMTATIKAIKEREAEIRIELRNE